MCGPVCVSTSVSSTNTFTKRSGAIDRPGSQPRWVGWKVEQRGLAGGARDAPLEEGRVGGPEQLPHRAVRHARGLAGPAVAAVAPMDSWRERGPREESGVHQ